MVQRRDKFAEQHWATVCRIESFRNNFTKAAAAIHAHITAPDFEKKSDRHQWRVAKYIKSVTDDMLQSAESQNLSLSYQRQMLNAGRQLVTSFSVRDCKTPQTMQATAAMRQKISATIFAASKNLTQIEQHMAGN